MTGPLELSNQYIRQGGLLVPVDAVAEPALTGAAAELHSKLAAERDLTAVQRVDEWTRKACGAEHRIAMDEVAERATLAKRARRGRARDAEEAEALGRLYARAAHSGERARIRAQIQGSAEMRALRVAKVRSVTLLAGIPVLLAFAAWSTTGVQAGVVRLLRLEVGSPAWAASWGMEPALIAIVALIIIGRAVLRSSGGDTDGRATAAEWAALGLSLALNIFGGFPDGAGFWAGVASALPHSIGPIGCAGTAFLVGLFDSYVTDARPWQDAPRLAELKLPGTPGTDRPDTDAGTAGTGVLFVGTASTGTAPAGTTPSGTGTGPVRGTGTAALSSVPAPVPARRAGGTGTGPGRAHAVPATGTGRRAITGRTGTPVPGERGSAKAAARAFWDREVAAGRTPTGTDLARAAGRDGDDTGVFRRYAREFAESMGGGSGAAAS